MEQKKVKQIINPDISLVSFVKEGANKKRYSLVKDAGNKSPVFEKTVRIIKNANKRGVVYGVVYEPMVLDTDGHFADEETIIDMCHSFSKNVQDGDGGLDENHSYIPGAGYVMENMCMFEDTKIGDEIIKKGSWVIGVKPDEKILEKIESGDYHSFSLAGYGDLKSVDVWVDDDGRVSMHTSKTIKAEENEKSKLTELMGNMLNKVEELMKTKEKPNEKETVTEELLKSDELQTMIAKKAEEIAIEKTEELSKKLSDVLEKLEVLKKNMMESNETSVSDIEHKDEKNSNLKEQGYV